MKVVAAQICAKNTIFVDFARWATSNLMVGQIRWLVKFGPQAAIWATLDNILTVALVVVDRLVVMIVISSTLVCAGGILNMSAGT